MTEERAPYHAGQKTCARERRGTYEDIKELLY
jgi:hypothetical protein